jgi:putative membrane protein
MNPSRAPNIFFLLLTLGISGGLAACSAPAGPRVVGSANGSAAPAAASATVAPEQLTAAERSFMTNVATRAMYEVEVSRLAVERATSPKVRAYAQTLLAHRQQVNSDLGALMRVKGVQRPAGLPADKSTKLHRLSALRPSPNFDEGFVRVVGVEDQAASIAMFERARRDSRDRDLRAWIERTLPVLRGDLAAARNLAGQLAG